MKIIKIGNTKIKVRNVREQVIDYLKDISENKACHIDFGIDDMAKIIIDYINELERKNTILEKNAIDNDKVVDKYRWENNLLKKKINDIVNYAKDRCDGYLEDLGNDDDCEYCDGAFASCRKVLQLAGEDIKKYE